MFSLDRLSIDVPCPRCGFYNYVFLGQVKLRDVIICRGCKINLQLDDYMNEYRKAEMQIRSAVEGLSKTFRINLNF